MTLVLRCRKEYTAGRYSCKLGVCSVSVLRFLRRLSHVDNETELIEYIEIFRNESALL